MPFGFFGGAAVFEKDCDLRCFGGGGGSGAGFRTGEDRKAVGDGITIVSILISYKYTKT